MKTQTVAALLMMSCFAVVLTGCGKKESAASDAVSQTAGSSIPAGKGTSGLQAVQDAGDQSQQGANQPSNGDFNGVYYTDRHSIRVVNRSGNYLYQSWRLPKSLDEGKPDLQLSNGWHAQVGSGQCTADKVIFEKGNLTMDLVAVNGQNYSCFGSQPPDGAVGELTIYINGNRKDHYWMFR